jgi:tetratricopeptide (TPR) repeat protein
MIKLKAIFVLLTFAALGACASVQASRAPYQAATYEDFLVGRYAALTQDPHEAAKRYARLAGDAPRELGLEERAVYAALQAGDYALAVSQARQASAANNHMPIILQTLAAEDLRRGRVSRLPPEASRAKLSVLNKVLLAHLRAWQAFDARGLQAGQASLAAARVNDAAADAATDYMSAMMLMAARRDAEAEAAFASLWSKGVKLSVGAVAYAELLAARGEHEEAVRILTEFRKEAGINEAAEALRERIEAGDVITPARLTARQGGALSLYIPASILMSQALGEPPAAYLTLALALDPELDAARILAARTWAGAGRSGQALDVLKPVMTSSVLYAAARGEAAAILLREGRGDEALSTAREALAAKPDTRLKVRLTDLLRSLERHAEAEPILTEVIESEAKAGHKDWRHYFARGAARESMGSWRGAEADLKMALQLQPDNATVLNYLGYSYVDRGENLDEGFRLIQRAVELEPNSGAIVDSLGWAYFKRGQFEKATLFLERAVELDPSSPVLNDHLGDAYWTMGRQLEARYQWKRALTQKPKEADRAAIQQKLKSGLPAPAPGTLADARTYPAVKP